MAQIFRKVGRQRLVGSKTTPAARVGQSQQPPPFHYPKFWSQGSAEDFIAPNLLLLLFASAAVTFPAGRSQATDLPPLSTAQPVAVGWQAPFNPVFLGEALTTIPSARVIDLPPEPLAFVPADLPQNLLPLTTVVAVAPFAQRDWPLPQGLPRFSPGEWQQNFQRFLKPSIPSADLFDLPARLGLFRQADVPANLIPLQTPPAAAPYSQKQWDLPAVGARFVSVELANQILPAKEVFTGFPVRQQDWPLPYPRPGNEYTNFVLEPNYILNPPTPPVPAADAGASGLGRWPRHLARLRKLEEEERLEAEKLAWIQVETAVIEQSILAAKDEKAKAREVKKLERNRLEKARIVELSVLIAEQMAQEARQAQEAQDEEDATVLVSYYSDLKSKALQFVAVLLKK